MTSLVLAPHPDDEILGCGGTIAKLSNSGNLVHIVIVTRGTPRLWSSETIECSRQECQHAASKLGVKSTRFLDFEAPELDRYPQAQIAEALKSIIDDIRPNTLYIPHRGDIHYDHSAVAQAALVAARPVGNCPVKQILAYETLSETEWGFPSAADAFIPNYFVDISLTLTAKKEAMLCYTTQLQKAPHPRSIEAIEALAKLRGSTIGSSAAEAFMVLRWIT